MRIHRLTAEDVPWVAERLAERRERLRPFAPVFWRPAVDAQHRHEEFLSGLLAEDRSVGFRTDGAVVMAHHASRGWEVDDAVVPEAEWSTTGQALWEALVDAIGTAPARFVCPVPEPRRAEFAVAKGFRLVESWWHRDVPVQVSAASSAPPAAAQVGPLAVPKARAYLVEAPPIYHPSGPVLYLTEVSGPEVALDSALRAAEGHAAPIVVVSQPATDLVLPDSLQHKGFRRHCDFLEAPVRRR